MSTTYITISVGYIIFTIFFIGLILIQKKRSSGMGSTMSGAGSNSSGGGQSTYWEKNKGNSIEGKLSKYTAVAGVIFFLYTFIISLVS